MRVDLGFFVAAAAVVVVVVVVFVGHGVVHGVVHVKVVVGLGIFAFAVVVGVVGTAAPVTIVHAESTDQLVINGNAGNDVIDASALVAGQISLTLNGGLGADVLIGSQGDDLVNGGDGNDLALMGAGDDTFVWNPGDDNDTIEGQAGVDTLLLFTDGILRKDEAFGDEPDGLTTALRSAHFGSAAEIRERIDGYVRDLIAEEQDDDIAVLVVRAR